MHKLHILTLFFFVISSASAQFVIDRNKIYGGNSGDEAKDLAANAAHTLFYFGGRTFSSDGDLPGNQGGSDFWIMKRNADGGLLWSKNYGGLSNDDLVKVMPHTDGGVLAFGTTHTSQGQFGTILGLAGGWLMRTNTNGNIIDGKIFGGQVTETAIDAERAINGDVVMLLQAGSTTLNGQTNHGIVDTWVVKVNSNFAILWTQLLGGTGSDIPSAITTDINGNIYIAAQTNSTFPSLPSNKGGFDTWIMKLDPNGQLLWQKSFGGNANDIPTDIILHPDGFVYVAIQSQSDSDDFDTNSGLNDIWILKLSEPDGNLLSKKRFGGSGNDQGAIMDLFKTDQLVVSSSTTSGDEQLTGNKGLSDVWIMTTDLNLNLLHQMNYGGSLNDVTADILAIDTAFHVLNSSLSNDKNVPANVISQQDMWYFTLNTHPQPCSDAFTCESDTFPTNILYPPDNNALTCVSGCTAGLGPGPDFFNTPCSDFLTPTAYFKVVTDTTSDLLTVSVTSDDFNRPRIAIFKTTNCSTYTQVQCASGTEGSVVISYLEVEPLTTYVIAVTDEEGNIGEFDFCASSLHVNFCNEGDRIYVTNTSKGSPASGPYKPGELVTFCYELYDWNKIECNGFQGLVPSFGPAWDSTSLDLFGMPLIVDTLLAPIQEGFWEWYKVGDVHYNISNPINGYDGGQGMPAGWYFTNTGDPIPHDKPDQTTGDNNDCLPTPSDKWKVCFTLKAVDDCEANLDATVQMRTFSDGELGSRLSLGCAYDQPEIYHAIMRCCLNPGITNIQDFSICSGDTISFVPETNLIPPVNFSWVATPDPFVSGSSNGFHQDKFYQVLNSSAIIPQNVRYSIRAEAGGCETGLDEFTVMVRQVPSAQLTLSGPSVICSGATVTLNIQLLGTPPFAIGLYRDNELFGNILSETNTISVDVDPVFSSSLRIGTLSDASCEGVGSGTVNVTVSPISTGLLDTAICQGEILVIGNMTFADPGNYSVLLEDQSVNGCDSMVNINLAVIPSLTQNITETICHGDSIVVAGMVFKETTHETIEYPGPEGCPNFINLDLTVKDTFTMTISQTICFGDTLNFEGIKVFQPGDYSHTEEVRPGCYEETVLHLTVLPQLLINDLVIQADNGHTSGAIIVEIVGGASPYTFKWNTGQTTESLFNIATGHYVLTVTDANGCKEEFEFEVPFVDATHDPGPLPQLMCYPTLLGQNQKIRLINNGKENLRIDRLEFNTLSGERRLLEKDINIPAEETIYEEVPAAITPGIYVLTAILKNGMEMHWKLVIQ